MSSTATRKPATRKPAAKATPTAAPNEQKPAAEPAPATAKPEPKPTTLIEALSTGQACLLKLRANGTKRSLPYLAVGTEQRKQAETVAKMREGGQTVETIAEVLKVSTATARRFITNLALAHTVEAGSHDKGWKPGTREVVVHVVTAKPTKA
ncbi:hypothetical protein GCM10023340_19450 [Nocardioides marinquilinus]|uniref:Helix-turn-helix domain-containing protein n=1 Tax=Nocardioides marinquilinus TaxID=1210400 RepID=A0ABP9PQ87_9ACTN